MDVQKTVRDWSLLPYDIACEVALKSDTIEDFVSFCGVCRAWSHVYSEIKLKWDPRIPFLLLAENTNNNDKCLRKLFSISRQRCWQLQLPKTFGKRCWGLSSAWIAMLQSDQQISIFNAFTQAQILLPTHPSIPKPGTEDYDLYLSVFYRKWRGDLLINKIIVWKVGKDDLLVTAVRQRLYYVELTFIRPGDKTWTYVITEMESYVFDVVCRGNKMFILYRDGAIVCCDLSETHTLRPLKPVDFSPGPHGILNIPLNNRFFMYLADSFGDLLLIVRYKVNDWKPKSHHKTWSFLVFRMNFESQKWKIKDLGDIALLVGDSSSISVHCSIFHNIKRNCIYFSDDLYHMTPCGACDLGVYDFKSKEIKAYYEGDNVLSTFCTPVWFIPSFS